MVMSDFGDLKDPCPKTKLNLWLRVLKHVEPQDVVKESICQQNAYSLIFRFLNYGACKWLIISDKLQVCQKHANMTTL